jgi:hypothetical protein
MILLRKRSISGALFDGHVGVGVCRQPQLDAPFFISQIRKEAISLKPDNENAKGADEDLCSDRLYSAACRMSLGCALPLPYLFARTRSPDFIEVRQA